jgi:Chaperone of endosialidase
LLNTTGTENTANGTAALEFNATGDFNTATGAFALFSNTAGFANTANGGNALLNNTTGDDNTAIGFNSLPFNTTGDFNTATGAVALFSNTTGSENTANGEGALLSNSTGDNNTANGVNALFSNTAGGQNTATGFEALFHNTASDNTANGASALFHNSTGLANTANGQQALYKNTTGQGNTANGVQALFNNTTGGDNIALGVAAGQNVTTANNVICIGAEGNNVDNACYIGQIFGATSSMGIAVFINSNGRLGTATSSRRFKEEIKPMDKTSEVLLALKPVTFRYKKDIDPAGTSQLGLVAEEVEKVNPDLVVRDKEGKPYSVRYDQVNAMLLNEFLKEHSTVQELKKEVAALTVGLQKVSAQLAAASPSRRGLELNKFAKGQISRCGPAPQTVSLPAVPLSEGGNNP